MSLVGQVDCQRIVIGPVWPFEIIGNASAVAPAAPAMNLRRVGLAAASAAPFVSSFLGPPSWVVGDYRRLGTLFGAGGDPPMRRILVCKAGKGNKQARRERAVLGGGPSPTRGNNPPYREGGIRERAIIRPNP